jgi:outer membrane receptor for ferrienterochelin and colicins
MSRNIAVTTRSHKAGQAMLGFFLATTALSAPALAQTAPRAENSTVLEQIVVTASGFEQNVKDAPASITVVTSEELAKGSYRDLTDALREVQGVSVTGVANERDIYIRGLPGSYTLLMVDGKRQNTRESRTNGNAGFEQSFLPPVSAIDRIEVVRGPMSSLYGSDAMGGVINVITKKVGDAWSGSVTTEGTMQQHSRSGNSGQVSWYANGPILKDMLGLQIWGRGFKRGEDSILNGDHAAKEYDFNGKLTFTPNDDHEVYLEGGASRYNREATRGNSATSNSAQIVTRDRWSLSHTGRWADTTTTQLSIHQEWGDRDSISSRSNGRKPVIRNTVVDAKLNQEYDLLGLHRLTVGGQFNQGKLTDANAGYVNLNGLQYDKFSATQFAVFLEDEWRILDDFALTGGLRLDHHEQYGYHLSPRLYGVWNATEQLTLKGGVSTGFRAPDIRQITPGYAYTTGGGSCVDANTWNGDPTLSPCGVMMGDPSLQPETTLSYEIAALWENDLVALGGTYFYTDFSDKIFNVRRDTGVGNGLELWSGDPKYALWDQFNVDSAILQGVELTATWHATSDLTLRGSYTFTHSEQQTGAYTGFPLARTPEHMAHLRADWITPVDGLQVWGAFNYHGEEIASGARIGSNGTPVTINGATGRKYDAFTTFDLGANYALNESVDFKAAIYNMLDTEISNVENNTIGEGRRFWVSMTAKF